MFRSIVTFVKSEMPLQSFLKRLEMILNVKFEQNPSADWNLFETVFMGLFIAVYENEGYIDEANMKFSNYDYVINVKATSAIPIHYKFDWERLFSVALINLLIKDENLEYLITDDVESVIEKSA